LIDFTIIQQDSFDQIDMRTDLERQKYMLNLILKICRREFAFEEFQEVRDFFKSLINILKQMNYSEYQSKDFTGFEEKLMDELQQKSLKNESQGIS
jgi:V/A-type H+-transporting ATPase subunit A